MQRRPLNTLVTSTNLGKLVEKLTVDGHNVDVEPLFDRYDVIFGENACRMVPELVDYVDVTIREAQRGRYGPRGGLKKADLAKLETRLVEEVVDRGTRRATAQTTRGTGGRKGAKP